jgi:hypothetical protein
MISAVFPTSTAGERPALFRLSVRPLRGRTDGRTNDEMCVWFVRGWPRLGKI